MTEKSLQRCPNPDVFDWYITKIKLMTLENRSRERCEKLVYILRRTIKDLVELQNTPRPMNVDDCSDEEYEECDDRCVPVGMCEILGGTSQAEN